MLLAPTFWTLSKVMKHPHPPSTTLINNVWTSIWASSSQSQLSHPRDSACRSQGCLHVDCSIGHQGATLQTICAQGWSHHWTIAQTLNINFHRNHLKYYFLFILNIIQNERSELWLCFVSWYIGCIDTYRIIHFSYTILQTIHFCLNLGYFGH